MRNVQVEQEKDSVSIAIQFKEELINKKIQLIPIVKEVSGLMNYNGHKEIDLCYEEILINSQQKVVINEEVLTIHYKNNAKEIIFQ